MKTIGKIVAGIILISYLVSCSFSEIKVYDLQCEMLNNPLGIDNTSPHLSWKMHSGQRGAKQASYQILAASSEDLLDEKNADLWNSGKINSEQSVWVAYSGEKLKSRSLVYWKVRVWDGDGKVSVWSPVSWFSVGLLAESDWTGRYIGLNNEEENPEFPLFRKTFRWSGNQQKAFLYINSLGYHEAYINGHKISDAVLAPAVSQPDKRSLAVAYDVSEYVSEGENEFVLWLSRGWYRKMGILNIEGGPYARAQLEALSDGQWIGIFETDETWLTRKSGYSDPSKWTPWQFGGEIIHAAELLSDLTAASLNSVEWQKVYIPDIPAHKVSHQMAEPNRIQEAMHPVSAGQLNDSTWIIDLGKNITGWTQIKFPPLSPDQKVTISYCDFLNADGSFRDKGDCDYYIASGIGDEVFINKFNYHAYRYIKLTNLNECPGLPDITSYLIHTDFKGASTFSCSDNDLNAIHDMIHYTFRCLTLGGYMVDCPHIERLGYGGDGNASTLAIQTMYNVAPLDNNWMQAWEDCIREDGSMPHVAPCPYQAGGGPYWCGFIITGSWQTYVNYGDKQLLAKHYRTMQKWLEYVKAYTVDGLLKRWPDTAYRSWYLGDWATPVGIDQTDPLSVDLVSNCYISQCYDTMHKIANVLGFEEDKEIYRKKRDEINQIIHSTFYLADKKTYSSGTQIDLIYPMLVGVAPEQEVQDVIKTLYHETQTRFNGHLSTGLVGIQVITEWATRNRKADFMYDMLKKRGYPGYLYMIDNGATTTWEHWDGDRSHIHNCYNGIGSWFYQALGGIIPDENNPGYRHLFISPQLVDGIDWVKTSKDVPQGRLSVEWEISDDQYMLEVDIPIGCSATVALPVKGQVFVNGKIFHSEIIHIGSGVHRFKCLLLD